MLRLSSYHREMGEPVAEEPDDESILRGPKGGRKHTPGRDHAGKSGAAKRKRFVKKRQRKRHQQADAERESWRVWDSLSDDAKRLRPEPEPSTPRPSDDALDR